VLFIPGGREEARWPSALARARLLARCLRATLAFCCCALCFVGAMQVVRLLRSRLHAPPVASFRGSHIAFVRSQYAAVGNNSLLAKVGPSPSFSGQLTTTLFHQNSHLRTLKLLQPAIWQFGK
jgi:hypothetical protein